MVEIMCGSVEVTYFHDTSHHRKSQLREGVDGLRRIALSSKTDYS
jgi:hypothetical protein